jgi:hypothetical protein
MIRDGVLRRARVARGLTLEDVGARTRLSPRLVTLLDEGRFDELPRGLYARSYVKAFAAAVGLDPDSTLLRVERFLPGVPDPVAAIRESIGCAIEAPALAADLERIWSSIHSRARATLSRPTATPYRIIAARAAGACVDTLLLASLGALLVRIVGWFSDATIAELVDAAGAAVATLCAVTWVSYYVLLAGIGNDTAGTWLCGSGPARQSRPRSLGAVLARAWRAWFDQASILVDVAMYADPAPVKSLLARLDLTRRRAA